MLRTRKRQLVASFRALSRGSSAGREAHAPAAGARSALSSAPAMHRQPFLAIEALRLPTIDHDPVPTEQDMQPAIPGPPPLRSDHAQARTDLGIVLATGAVAYAHAISTGHRARASLTDSERRPEMRARLTPGDRAHQFYESKRFRPALSSIASPSSRFSLELSSSGAFSRRASDTSSPPNLASRSVERHARPAVLATKLCQPRLAPSTCFRRPRPPSGCG